MALARTLVIVLLVGLLAGSLAANFMFLQQQTTTSDEANRLRVRAVSAEATRASLATRVDELEARLQASPGAIADGSAASPSAAQVELIAQQVERVRGVRRSRALPIQFRDQAALTQYVRQAYERDYQLAERESDQKLLTTFGLLKPGEDLFQIVEPIATNRPLGLYSLDDRTLYVVGSADESLPTTVQLSVAREIGRALLDQAYDLSHLQPKHGDNNDRAAAIHALIEGDLNLTQRLWAEQNLSAQVLANVPQPDTHLLDEAPPIVRADALFAPVAGQRFADQLFQQTGSFAGVDSAYKAPPLSTAQILHPDKYASRAQPLAVDLPDLAKALAGGWRQVDSNVMGAFDLFNLLAQDGDGTLAAAAVSGWAGDRWQLLEQNGGQAVVLRTMWDSEENALAFFNAYAIGLKVRFVAARIEMDSTTRLAQTASNAATELRLSSREVLAVIAFDRPSADAIITALGR